VLHFTRSTIANSIIAAATRPFLMFPGRDPASPDPSFQVMQATTPRPAAPTPRSSAILAPSAGEVGLLAFLTRLQVALNRRRTYGATHPMVVSTEEEAQVMLDKVLARRSSFTIGVAKQELLLNGTPIVGAAGTARELASRLHRRGVGALTFHAGVDLQNLQLMLEWLAHEPSRDDAPDAAPEQPPTIAGIIIGRLAYDALMLGDADKIADASIAALWQALAQIAADGTGRQYGFGTERNADVSASLGDDDRAFDVMVREEEQVSDIAQSLQQLVSQPEFARRTAVALMNLAAQGAQAPPELRARIGERLHAVISRLGDSSFAPIIRGLGQRAEQQEFMLQVVDVLPVLAVSNWLQVAARATEQELSHHLLRLMTKLSQHAVNKRQSLTDATFRGAAKELVEGWVLSDPNPDEHIKLLDRIALVHEGTVQALGRDIGRNDNGLTEAARVVQMALEIDTVGDDALAAATAVVEGGNLPQMLSWLDEAGTTDSSKLFRARIMAPDAVRKLLQENPVNEAAARALLATMDISMADTLLEALSAAESREARDVILERLRSFGEPLRLTLIARLNGASWFFARNLLGLLRDLIVGQKGTSDVGSMLKFLDHENPMVRVEAVRMLLDVEPVRDAAIRRGLSDADERVAAAVLDFVDHLVHTPKDARRKPLSIGATGYLVRFVESTRHPVALQVIAIRAAAASGAPSVRDWLLSRILTKSTFLRRPVLAKPSLINATALSALQKFYADDTAAAPALTLGRDVRGDAHWRAPTPYAGSAVVR
jgi:hypothetical protein